MATGNTAKWTGIYGRSTPKPDLDPGTIAFKNPPPAATLPANATAEQKVAALKQTFLIAIGNVAANRKIIYGVLVDIKEHFHEYGFKSAAAGVEIICKRSKSWSNAFMAEIEAELQIYGQVANSVATEPDTTAKKESAALKKVEQAREDEPEKPHIKTRDEILEEQKPQITKATENGKPKYLLAVWRDIQDGYGKVLNRIDEANRVVPDKAEHDWLIAKTKECMDRAERWHGRAK